MGCGGDDAINTPEYVARGEYVLAREQRRKARALEAVKRGRWPPKRHPEDDEIEAERRKAWKHVVFQATEPEIDREVITKAEDIEMATNESGVFVSRGRLEKEILEAENTRLKALLESVNASLRSAEDKLLRREVEWRYQQDARNRELSERSAGWTALEAFRAKTENAEIARLRGEHDGFKEALAEAQSAFEKLLSEKSEEVGRIRCAMAAAIGEKERLQEELEKSEKAGQATLNALYEARSKEGQLRAANEMVDRLRCELKEAWEKIKQMNRAKRRARDAKRAEKASQAVDAGPQVVGASEVHGGLNPKPDSVSVLPVNLAISPEDVDAAMAEMPEFGAVTNVDSE